MIDPKLLAMLRCPIEGAELHLAEEPLILRVQSAIERGEARDRIEQKVSEPIDGGLVSETRQWLYPIRDGIPTLVIEEAIRIDDLEPSTNEPGKF